jgi:hypothetical protein
VQVQRQQQIPCGNDRKKNKNKKAIATATATATATTTEMEVVSDLKQVEPDPMLFTVPSDYRSPEAGHPRGGNVPSSLRFP